MSMVSPGLTRKAKVSLTPAENAMLAAEFCDPTERTLMVNYTAGLWQPTINHYLPHSLPMNAPDTARCSMIPTINIGYGCPLLEQ